MVQILFDQFIPVLVFGLAGIIFVAIMMTLSILNKAKTKPSELKLMTYECGEIPAAESEGFQLNYQYFIYAIVFTVLDILSIFLYSWAVSQNRLSDNTLLTLGIFVGLMVLAFIYVAYESKHWKRYAM